MAVLLASLGVFASCFGLALVAISPRTSVVLYVAAIAFTVTALALMGWFVIPG